MRLRCVLAGLALTVLLIGCSSAQPKPPNTPTSVASAPANGSAAAGATLSLGDRVAVRVPEGWKASWRRTASLPSRTQTTSAIPRPVAAATLRPTSDGDDSISVEVYSSRPALDSFLGTYRAIVDLDRSQGAASREVFTLASPKGVSFVGFARTLPGGVSGVTMGPPAYEMTLFSQGASAPPVRIVAAVHTASPLFSCAKEGGTASAQLLAHLGL